MGKGRLIVTLSLFCSLNKLNSASLTSVRPGFPNPFILDLFPANALTSLVLFSQIVWIVEFTRPYSVYMSAFFFPLYICHVTLIFSSTLKTIVLFVTVAMLSLNQSPINCRNSNVEGNVRHKKNYHHYGHFLGPEFLYLS
jgi:hypothetical protein